MTAASWDHLKISAVDLTILSPVKSFSPSQEKKKKKRPNAPFIETEQPLTL